MIERILEFSIRWRGLVVILGLVLVVFGVYSATRLPIDAVPDITWDPLESTCRHASLSIL